jgi:hypothetical protein
MKERKFVGSITICTSMKKRISKLNKFLQTVAAGVVLLGMVYGLMEWSGYYNERTDALIRAHNTWALGKVVDVRNRKGDYANVEYTVKGKLYSGSTSIPDYRMQEGEHYRVWHLPDDPTQYYVDLNELIFLEADSALSTYGNVDKMEDLTFRFEYWVNGYRYIRWQRQVETTKKEVGASCLVRYAKRNPQFAFLDINTCR